MKLAIKTGEYLIPLHLFQDSSKRLTFNYWDNCKTIPTHPKGFKTCSPVVNVKQAPGLWGEPAGWNTLLRHANWQRGCACCACGACRSSRTTPRRVPHFGSDGFQKGLTWWTALRTVRGSSCKCLGTLNAPTWSKNLKK